MNSSGTLQQSDASPAPSWGSIIGGIGLAFALVLVVVLAWERVTRKK